MSSWEWRVFCPCSPSDKVPGEVWSLIGARASRRAVEHRTDAYLTCTAGAGLKLRGGKQMEVKLRHDKNSEGAERWSKIIATSIPRGVDVQNPGVVCDAFKGELLKIQPKLDKSGLKENLAETIAALATPQRLVTVTKARVKEHVRSLCVDSVEETIVTVSGEDVKGWRSVCLESSKADNISKALSTKIKANGSVEEVCLRDYFLSLGGSVQGYPQFVIDRVTADPK